MYRHQTIYCFHLYLIIDPYICFQNATFDIDAMRQYKFIPTFSYFIFVIKLKSKIFFEKKVSNKKSWNFYYFGVSIFLFLFFFCSNYTVLTFRIYGLNSFPKFPSSYLIIWSYKDCSKSRCYANHLGKKEYI